MKAFALLMKASLVILSLVVFIILVLTFGAHNMINYFDQVYLLISTMTLTNDHAIRILYETLKFIFTFPIVFIISLFLALPFFLVSLFIPGTYDQLVTYKLR
jgi:hypothetical protein